MKSNYLYTILFSFALVGCNEVFEPGDIPVSGTVNVSSASNLTNDTGARASRIGGEETVTYHLEAWTHDANPACAYRTTAQGTVDAAEIAVKLIPGAYDFLIWADYNKGCYNTDDLRNVSMVEGASRGADSDAWAGTLLNVQYSGGNSLGTTLVRPLAKLTICNTENFTETNTVSVEYIDAPTCYDVMTGEASSPKNYTVTYPETGTESPMIEEDYVFVPTEETVSFNLTISDTSRLIENIQIKKNYKTTITGNFSN